MKQVFFTTQDDSWHVWRATGIGGSDAPVIGADAGLCKPAGWQKSLEELWRVKTGRATDLGGPNWGMQKGIRAEPLARRAFEAKTGIVLNSSVYGEMDLHPFVHSSFDGVDITGDFLGEIKFASRYLHDLAKSGEVVTYYRPQLAHQALTKWGMPETWRSEHTLAFISYDYENDDLAYVIKSALEYRELAEKLMQAELTFWNNVQNNMEPISDQWRAAAFRFLAARARMDELKQEEEEAKAILVELAAGNDKKAGAGVSVTKQSKQGAVDYNKLLSELTSIDSSQIDKYRKPESESYVVRTVKRAA